jgi:hypothetical protein
MKKTIIFYIVIALYGCKSYNVEKKLNDRQIYVYNFKGSFIRSCFYKGFNNNSEINKLLKSDKSYISDFMLGEKGYKKIDSLAKSISQEIETDSIESINNRAEGSIGKRVIEKCICFYESNKLDSIANKMYVIHKK